MNTILISYDLRIPESSADYQRLIAFIKSYGTWAKPLKSLWLIKTNKSPATVRDELRAVIDFNDGLLTIDVTKDDWASYGINSTVIKWMHDNM